MLVFEGKLRGTDEQYAALDEAIRTVRFVRNKALRYWMDNRGINGHDLNKYCAVLAKEFPFAKTQFVAVLSAKENNYSVIANLTQTGWEVIYHRAHALLAAQIGGHWHSKDRPERLIETVAAISDRDDLEREWEGNHLTEAGAPLDFTVVKKTSIEKLRELTTNAQYRGRWVALLISMHVSFLNEGKRTESAELDSFLDEQKENQKRWIEELRITQEEAD